MKIVFASYVYTPAFKNPVDWLTRINFYTGTLQALAVNHTIISIEQIDFEGEYKQGGVQYYFKRFTKSERRFPAKLHGFIKSHKPDVVFINGLHFPLQVIQLRRHLGPGVKILAQHHAEQPFTGIKKIAQRLADRYIDAYFFASRDMGLDWINKGNLSSPDKIHGVMEVSSVFHPLEREAALAETGVEGQPVFLWVGRLEANKDPLTVVKGFLKFTEDKPLARLYMIYQTEELIAPITRLLDADLNNTITLVGKVPHAQLLYWFNSADFIISGSHYEGSGTVVCEAMSCGCVPVVTDIPSFKMMTDNGKFGLLYEAGNADALHLALLESCKLDRSEMKENVMAYYRTKLSFAAIAAEIERVALSL